MSYADISERQRDEERIELAVAERTRDLHLTLEEMSRAKEFAESEAYRTKSMFLANVNHELRTHMNGIVGMTALAKQRISDTTTVAHLEKAERSARSLLLIINDLIQIADIESKRGAPLDVRFALATVCDEVAAELQKKARDKGLTFDINVPCAMGTKPLRGDPERLTNVLLKLGDNAIKFTHAGFVKIDMGVVAESPTDLELRVEVKDSGIGIALADRGRLFNPFEQLDGSLTRQYGGLGLGLAISKRLVESMGGTIGLKSGIGKGSTFWFVVRLRTE